MISKTAYELFQLQRDVKPRTGIELIPPKIILDDDNVPSHDQDSDDRISPQEMPENEEIPSDKEGGDNRIPP